MASQNSHFCQELPKKEIIYNWHQIKLHLSSSLVVTECVGHRQKDYLKKMNADIPRLSLVSLPKESPSTKQKLFEEQSWLQQLRDTWSYHQKYISIKWWNQNMCETLGVLGLWPVSQLVIYNIGVNRRTRRSYINFQHKQYTQVRSLLHPYLLSFFLLSNLRLKLETENICINNNF